jgi:hypothetical protein
VAENVPYTPFPTVQPNGAGLPEQNASADPAAFGAGFDQSLERFGARVSDIQDREFAQQLQFAQMREETSALNAATQFSQATTQSEVNFSKLRGQQAVDALPQFQADLDKQQAEIAKTLKSPMAQRAYLARSASYKVATFKSLGLHAATQSEVAMDAASAAAVSAAQSRFANHYGLADVEPDLNEIVALSAQQAMDKGLPKEAADVLIQKNTSDAIALVIGARIFNGNAAQAEEIFKAAAQQKVPGTDLPLLDGEHLVSLGAGVKRAKEAEALDEIQAAERADRAQEAARRDTQNDFLARMQQGKLNARDVLVSNLHPFGSGSKEEFLRMLKDGIGGGLNNDPETYIALWDRIHKPDGDPQKIADENALNSFLGHGLNFDGVNQLRAEIAGKRTQEGSVQSDLKKDFTSMAKSKISGTNPLLGLRDSKGDENFYRFMNYFLPSFDKAVKAGENPIELLAPDGIFGKAIQQYQRTPAQMMQDIMSDSGGGTGVTAATGAGAPPPITARPSGEIPKIKNDAEYARLPPGTSFIDPTGKQRRKP